MVYAELLYGAQMRLALSAVLLLSACAVDDDGDPIVDTDAGVVDAGPCQQGFDEVQGKALCARWIAHEPPPHSIDALHYGAHGTADWIFVSGPNAVATFWLDDGRWSDPAERLVQRRSTLHYLGDGRYLDIGAGVAAEDKEFYLPDSCSQRVAIYDVFAESWEELEPFPFAPGIGFAPASALIHDELFIHGGFSPCVDGEASLEPRREAYAFDPDTLTWREMPSSPKARALHRMFRLDEENWLALGASRQSADATYFAIYHADTALWSDNSPEAASDLYQAEAFSQPDGSVVFIAGTSVANEFGRIGPSTMELEFLDVVLGDPLQTKFAGIPSEHGLVVLVRQQDLPDSEQPKPLLLDLNSFEEAPLPDAPAIALGAERELEIIGFAVGDRCLFLEAVGEFPAAIGSLHEVVFAPANLN